MLGRIITVHSLKWAGDKSVSDSDPQPDDIVLYNSIVVVDGEVIEQATGVTVEASGGDFVRVSIHIAAADVQFVSHTQESWDELMGK